MDIPSILPPSLLAERLESLAYLYKRADSAVAAFVAASGVSCPFGCGSCCEGFVPDILPVEAAYLAAYLAASDRPRAYEAAAGRLGARSYPDGRQGCPLYRTDTPYHCGVYEARPLICRMFAFSRITSYNVCYTKLLRRPSPPRRNSPPCACPTARSGTSRSHRTARCITPRIRRAA